VFYAVDHRKPIVKIRLETTHWKPLYVQGVRARMRALDKLQFTGLSLKVSLDHNKVFIF